MINKKWALIYVIGFFMCLSSAFGDDTIRMDLADDISIEELISNPQAYDGQQVTVQGFLLIAFEETAIYASEADFAKGDYQRSLWAAVDMVKFRNFDQQNVVIDGVFDADHKGHRGLWPGAITEITDMRQVDDRTNAREVPEITSPEAVQGLVLQVTASKETFSIKEPLVIDLRFENTTDEPLWLYWKEMYLRPHWLYFEFVDERDYVWIYPPYPPTPFPMEPESLDEFVRVDPGQTFEYSFDIVHYVETLMQDMPEKSAHTIRVKAIYRNRVVENPFGIHPWIGEVASREVPLTILSGKAVTSEQLDGFLKRAAEDSGETPRL